MHIKEPCSCHIAKFFSNDCAMYLGEGYNKGLCGGVNKEFKEVNGVSKAVVLYNWENDGVFAQERFPEGQ